MPTAVSREKHSCKLCLAGREKAALSKRKGENYLRPTRQKG